MAGRILTANDLSGDQDIRTQAVVVGSGAGGATTANLLSRAGKDVLVIEEGARQPTDSFSNDIPEMMGRLYRGAGLTPILGTPNIAYAEGKCLGGSTVINGGLMMRPPEDLLRDWSDGLQLPGMGAEDLEQFFQTLEGDLSVATQPDRAANKASWRMADAAEKLNWRTEHTPRAQAGCQNSNRCPTGCPNGAKQSMLVSYLPAAMAKGAEILCDARGERIVLDGARATGVEVVVGGAEGMRRILIRADDVFICGGPMQTPYLLQGSGLKRNIGNSLNIHLNLKVVAIFPDDIDPAFGTIMAAQVKEFGDRGLYIGSSNFDLVYLALTLAQHGTSVVEGVMENWRRAGIYVAQIKASGQGRVRRTRLMDRPMPSYSLTGEDMENIRFALLRVCEVLLSAGAEKLFLPIAGSRPVCSMEDAKNLAGGKINPALLDLLSVHGMGSCPLGASASTSALDPFGRIWAVDNLYVNDASMLPGATGVSPQLTTMAVAMRNAAAFLDGGAGNT